MSVVAPDEQVRRVRACLAEMGYEDADVVWEASPTMGNYGIRCSKTMPLAVYWQALYVSGAEIACWSCKQEQSGDPSIGFDCIEGRCHNLGPKTPPRELLVSRRA
jgi:hypothetical protein